MSKKAEWWESVGMSGKKAESLAAKMIYATEWRRLETAPRTSKNRERSHSVESGGRKVKLGEGAREKEVRIPGIVLAFGK